MNKHKNRHKNRYKWMEKSSFVLFLICCVCILWGGCAERDGITDRNASEEHSETAETIEKVTASQNPEEVKQIESDKEKESNKKTKNTQNQKQKKDETGEESEEKQPQNKRIETELEGTYEELIADPQAWEKICDAIRKESRELAMEELKKFRETEITLPVADGAKLEEISRRAEESYAEIKGYGFRTIDPAEGPARTEEWEKLMLDWAAACDTVHNLYDRKYISQLNFLLLSGTLLDCGDYYTAEALFMQDVKVPADLEIGESYTFVINELTQETMTVTCCEAPETYWDVMLVSDEGMEYYYWTGGEAGKEVNLEHDSADIEQKTVGKGIIRLRKDVIIGETSMYEYENFHPSRQMIGYLSDSWYNEAVFDEDGCITWLCFYGD